MSAMAYKQAFLRMNKISAEAFERIYIAFMKSNPDEAAYRRFAGKYNIAIIPHPVIPSDVQTALCVNINVIKVLAHSDAEADAAVRDIMSVIPQSKTDD